MTTSNLFRQLDDEWQTLASSAPAREATRRWGHEEPRLLPFADPAQLVAQSHVREDAATAHRLLGALLRVADDDVMAQRALLQAVLPGLAALSRRGRRLGWCRTGGVWSDTAELDQELVGLAWERIAALAGQDLGWPAMTIVDQVWRRARVLSAQHRRQRRRCDSLNHPSAADRVPAEEEAWEPQMTRLLCDAVRRGTIPLGDGAVIFTTRVIGVPTAEVAQRLDVDVRTLLQRRYRAERRLAAAWADAA